MIDDLGLAKYSKHTSITDFVDIAARSFIHIYIAAQYELVVAIILPSLDSSSL